MGTSRDVRARLRGKLAKQGQPSGDADPRCGPTQEGKLQPPTDPSVMRLLQDAQEIWLDDQKKAVVLYKLAARKGYLPSLIILAAAAGKAKDDALNIEALCLLLLHPKARSEIPNDILDNLAANLSLLLLRPENRKDRDARQDELRTLGGTWPILAQVERARETEDVLGEIRRLADAAPAPATQASLVEEIRALDQRASGSAQEVLASGGAGAGAIRPPAGDCRAELAAKILRLDAEVAQETRRARAGDAADEDAREAWETIRQAGGLGPDPGDASPSGVSAALVAALKAPRAAAAQRPAPAAAVGPPADAGSAPDLPVFEAEAARVESAGCMDAPARAASCAAPAAAGAAAGVASRGAWERVEGGWRFSVTVPTLSSLGEGQFEILQDEIRLVGCRGEVLAHEPIPRGTSAAQARPKWSRKSRTLAVFLPFEAPRLTGAPPSPHLPPAQAAPAPAAGGGLEDLS